MHFKKYFCTWKNCVLLQTAKETYTTDKLQPCIRKGNLFLFWISNCNFLCTFPILTIQAYISFFIYKKDPLKGRHTMWGHADCTKLLRFDKSIYVHAGICPTILLPKQFFVAPNKAARSLLSQRWFVKLKSLNYFSNVCTYVAFIALWVIMSFPLPILSSERALWVKSLLFNW